MDFLPSEYTVIYIGFKKYQPRQNNIFNDIYSWCCLNCFWHFNVHERCFIFFLKYLNNFAVNAILGTVVLRSELSWIEAITDCELHDSHLVDVQQIDIHVPTDDHEQIWNPGYKQYTPWIELVGKWNLLSKLLIYC